MPLSAVDSLDLATLAQSYADVGTSTASVCTELLRRRDAYPDRTVWIHEIPREALLDRARALEKRRDAGENLPLYGIPFAVKDNFDVAGLPTTAGCPSYQYIARQTAPVVQRLLDAGALLVGKTNLDQFATGLAGDRSPYGACRNLFDGDHIAGGSSSGSAVAVAAGLVTFALGTDTAGSGRVPAACNNVVGLKPAPGTLSTEGVVPACPSLDCVSIFALTAADARTVFEVAAGPPRLAETATGAVTFAVPRSSDLEFFGDDGQAHLFEQAQARLEQRGWRKTDFDFAPFREVAALLYEGPWLAERFAALEEVLHAPQHDVLPVTRAILEGGARYRGTDVFRGQARLQLLRKECLKAFERAEVLLTPTVPTVPRLDEVQRDSMGWSRKLGQYTNFANLLGLAALALPTGFTPRGLPGGATLFAPAGAERRLCDLGTTWQQWFELTLGATRRSLPAPGLAAPGQVRPPAPAEVRVAVAGAHLRGQPLHPALLQTGARFVRTCRTAPRYRFLGLLELRPPRPGLLRDDACAGAIAVEIFDLPLAGFGALVASVAPPLAIGTIELEDGEAVKGFLCESFAAVTARDLTAFGGWLAFREHLASQPVS